MNHEVGGGSPHPAPADLKIPLILSVLSLPTLQQLVPSYSQGVRKASWPALQPGGWHSHWRGSPALRGVWGRSPSAASEETQVSGGAVWTHTGGVQRDAQRLSHPGRSALERSMGTAAQLKSVPHYPPWLPTDPSSVTSHSPRGPSRLVSCQPSHFCTTSPASAAGRAGPGLASTPLEVAPE